MSIFKRVRFLSTRFIDLLSSFISTILRRRFISYIFKSGTVQKGITSAGPLPILPIHTRNGLAAADNLHFWQSFRLNLPFTPSSDDNFSPPKSYKRKALLIGVEVNDKPLTERGLDTRTNQSTLKGPHQDVRDMRQFLIGRFDSIVSNVY
jgi:hypothetical protein